MDSEDRAQPLVAVVEDDRSVREMLCAVLDHAGHETISFSSGEDALADPRFRTSSLVILDLGLPGASGLDVCRRLRQTSTEAQVLMLTARHQVSDRVAGLDAGADDYLVKPFALEELMARVRSALRRGVPVARGRSETITVGDLSVDCARRVAMRGTDELELTKTQFDLLELLARNSPSVLTREVIHERIWGYDEGLMSNSLEVFVSHLRRKTESGGRARIIHTVRGVGYVLRSSP